MPNKPLGFIIKDWDFVGAGTNPDAGTKADYPYWNIPKNQVNGNPVAQMPGTNDWYYEWTYQEVKDKAGEPGQNTSNPASLFADHFVALINGTYYDPSYGNSLSE